MHENKNHAHGLLGATASEVAPSAVMLVSRHEVWVQQGRTQIMGILNVTPDSFSDGGQLPSVEAAVAAARQMVAAGADLLDIGGQSTRPGSDRLPADVELQRVLPVIRSPAYELIYIFACAANLGGWECHIYSRLAFRIHLF